MGNVLHKDELDSAIGSSIFSSLESDASDAESLLQTISAYVENSRDKLKGETWKASFESLDRFKSALELRKRISETLGPKIIAPLKSLSEYMSPYDTLDSSWLKDLEDSKKGYETSIQSLKDKVNSKTREEGTENYIYVYSEDERRKMNGTIKDYNAIIEALDPLIEKVKGLDAVYSAAYGQLTDGFGDISKLESANSKLTPSPLVYYKPNA